MAYKIKDARAELKMSQEELAKKAGVSRQTISGGIPALFPAAPPPQPAQGGTTMKKVLITYHMTNGEEDAETCIALPMADEVAEDVLTWGDDSRYIRRGGAVRQALDALARMQGYSYTMFCTAELVQ